MNVLSLFNGISGARLALDRAGINVTHHYSSEIDKYANAITQFNYPDTIHLGDITKWKDWDIEQPDLIVGGFPCQSYSQAGKRLGDKCPKNGRLIYDFIDVINYYKPKYFLMENVKGFVSIEKGDVLKRLMDDLTSMGYAAQYYLINSALVSAQNRQRVYITNITGIEQPADKGILLKDIIESGEVDRDKSLVVTTRAAGATKKRYKEKSMHQMVVDRPVRVGEINKGGQGDRIYSIDGKGITLSAQSGGTAGNGNTLIEQPCEPKSFNPESICHHAADATDIKGHAYNKRVYAGSGKAPSLAASSGGNLEPKVLLNVPTAFTERRTEKAKRIRKEHNILDTQLKYRKLTPVECCRLQTYPDNWCDYGVFDEVYKPISNSQKYKALGNSFTVDVIAHILKGVVK